MYVRVGENIIIDLENFLLLNFYYNLLFGDGSEENKMLGFLNELFRGFLYEKNYIKFGLYIIIIFVWNGKYMRKYLVIVFI